MPFSERPERSRREDWDDDSAEEFDPDPQPEMSAGTKGLIAFLLTMIVLGGLGGMIWFAVSALQEEFNAPGNARERIVDRAQPPAGERREQNVAIPRETLEHVKAATVFIKVATEEYMAAGSGFVMKVEGDSIWVVTNEHVVAPPPERRFGFGPNFPRPRFGPRFGPGRPPFGPGAFRGEARQQVTAVLHSGTPQEKSYAAEVVGSTKEPDLAILRLRNVAEPPKPLHLGQGVEVVELMPVLYLGFPFGKQLSLDEGNPSVSIGRGAVASLRRNAVGRTSVVQIEGELNPGNSGGPLVDTQGRLVGIVFAKVLDTRIGLAVHAGELAQVLRPRVDGMSVGTHTNNGAFHVQVEVAVSDPMHTLPEFSFFYAAANAPTGRAHPTTGWEPLANAQCIKLRRQGMKAIGIIQGEAARNLQQPFTYQFAYQEPDKHLMYTEPRRYNVTAAAKPPPAEPRADQPAQPRALPDPPQRPRPGRAPAEQRKIGKLPSPLELPGLLAHWSFDEGNGEIARDSTGKKHDIELHDTQWVEGVQGKALQFNGHSSYADIGSHVAFNFGEQHEFTFAFWVKTTARDGTLLSFRRAGQGAPVIDVLLEFGGRLKAEVRDNSTDRKLPQAIRGAVVNDGTWHHVALVRQADGVVLLYVDGGEPMKHPFPAQSLQFHFPSQGAITTDLRAWGSERFWVQSGRAQGKAYFDGTLDEACVFFRALSQHEIKKLAGVTN